MTDDNLTLRLEGGITATFISLSQKERFLRNHFYKGKFIHGFNMIKKSKEGYFYDHARIPKKLAIKNMFRKLKTMNKIDLDSYELQFRMSVNIGLHSLISRGKLGSNIIHDAYKRYCYGIAEGEMFLHLDKKLCRFFKADNVEEFKFLYFGRNFPNSNLFIFDWKRDDVVSILDSAKECLLEPVEKSF